MQLPMVDPPPWFLSELSVESDSNIVVFDDDVSVHQVWDERFEVLQRKNNLEIHNISNPNRLQEWTQTHDLSRTTFLCDYELLGQDKTGLDLIEELKLQDKAILVTSHSNEEGVLKRCEKLGIKCLPKNLIHLVPICEI